MQVEVLNRFRSELTLKFSRVKPIKIARKIKTSIKNINRQSKQTLKLCREDIFESIVHLLCTLNKIGELC